MFQDLENDELRILSAALAHEDVHYNNALKAAMELHDTVWENGIRRDRNKLAMLHSQSLAEIDRRNVARSTASLD